MREILENLRYPLQAIAKCSCRILQPLDSRSLSIAMSIGSISSVGNCTDGSANAYQASSRGFMLRVQAAIGPKQLDGGGLSGRVLVAFSISDNGGLAAVRVTQSSGEARLDRLALQIVNGASLPVPPPGLSTLQRTYISAFTFS